MPAPCLNAPQGADGVCDQRRYAARELAFQPSLNAPQGADGVCDFIARHLGAHNP